MANVTIDEIAEEVGEKMKNDDAFAAAVAQGISENDDVAEKMLTDTELAGKVSKHLLSGDVDLVSKVKGELEAQGFRVESADAAEDDYDKEQAIKDFAILAKSSHAGVRPKDMAKSLGEDTSMVTKSTDETNFTSAGLTIPTPMSDEIIPILTSQPVFLDAGAFIMEVPNGKLDLGRQNSDPTAQWQGEGDTITKSDAGFDLLQLTAHKLTVGHEFSNDFLRRDGRLIGEDFMFSRMMRAARNKLDSTILEGTGGSNQPEGLIQQVDSGHVDSSSGNTISNIADDLKTKKRQLAGADIPNENRVWFMREEVMIDFMFDLNSNEDTFPFREEVAEEGSMFGDDIEVTSNIDLDGSDQSNIYYVEMSEQVIGRGTDFEMATSMHESFSDDLTTLRLVSHWDYVMAHTKSASIIEDYTLQ